MYVDGEFMSGGPLYGFCRLATSVLPLLSNLTTLELDGPTEGEPGGDKVPILYGKIWRGVSFPCLRDLSLRLDHTEDIHGFLSRHGKALERLTCNSSFGETSKMLKKLHLPRLVFLNGYGDSIPPLLEVVKVPHLKEVVITNVFWPGELQSALAAVATVIDAQDQAFRLRLTHCHCNLSSILQLVIAQIPTVAHLDVEGARWDTAGACFSEYMGDFEKFQNLKSFKWPPSLYTSQAGPTGITIHETVVLFGKHCPKLEKCQLPYGDKPGWIRSLGDMWIPSEEV
ncbi:hypothetical protein VNI00_006763 [Paramarasmius palmivorus]|uniref:Uncharacterized protein n=1 Tax=Paramarasmius palmivorus TaxID=297713 RepID=A0AAW0D900_9AGAR